MTIYLPQVNIWDAVVSNTCKMAIIIVTMLTCAPLDAQIIIFEQPAYTGRSFSTEQGLPNLEFTGFYERASSVIVMDDRWEVCDGARLSGTCSILRPGRYRSFAEMGLKGQLLSIRLLNSRTAIDEHRYAPDPITVYDNRRRDKEPLFEASVSAARAVFGAPEGPCWLERERVVLSSGEPTAAGLIVATPVGGILGHQMGSSYEQTAPTIGQPVTDEKLATHKVPAQASDASTVAHCTDIDSEAQPNYWDVLYSYRGESHRIQMTTQPGPTVMVNHQGEPRT